MFDSTLTPILAKLAVFAERRQEVLAGNIANIDTPGYRRRDLPVEQFHQAVREAVQARAAGGRSAATAAQLDDHLPPSLLRPQSPPPRNLTFQDANDRSIEHEVMQMTGNAMLHNFAVELLAAQMSMIETVLGERT